MGIDSFVTVGRWRAGALGACGLAAAGLLRFWLDRCKTHAAGPGVGGQPAPLAGALHDLAPAPQGCDIPSQRRARLAQGKPGSGRRWRWCGRWLLCGGLLYGGLPVARAADCPGPALRIEPISADVWLVPAAAGDSDAANRGQVSNLLLVREAPAGRGAAARWWLLGSGPSPAFGRALACQLRQRLGAVVSDVISPWARPELVLGVAGLAGGGADGGTATATVRHWAHAAVADAMAEQCPHCVARLRLRLGTAADDLGADPIQLPDHRLQGEQGVLGPFHWWRLPRAEGRWVTVWRLRDRPLWLAPGLLDGNGPPDGRDADLALLRDANRQLARWAAADGAAARFVGEQGPVMDSGAPARHADYWHQLLAAATAAVARGDDEAAPAPGWPGLPAGWAGHPWQGFNWQRAWRQVEPQVLASPTR